MKELKITSLMKFYTLCLLSERQVHGYDIIKGVGEKMGMTISSGQVYPFLRQLEKKRIIRVSETGGREKKEYILTPEGRTFVDNLIHKFADMVRVMFEKSLKTCAHCGCEIFRGGFTKRRKTFCCPACALAMSRGKAF